MHRAILIFVSLWATAGAPQAFICVGEICSLPVTDPVGLSAAIDAVRHR